ncbi:MAG: hypothetical protein ACOYJ2_02880 [Rickettsiales bacterium]
MSKNPTLEEFLAQVLPKDAKKPHALAVGEYHNHVGHLGYFSKKLKNLQTDNNLGAVGIELPPFMEVFLWAYYDREVTGVTADYVRRMFQAYNESEYSVNPLATADLAMKAIDNGLAFICFDARDVQANTFNEWENDIDDFKGKLEKDPTLRDRLLNLEDSEFTESDKITQYSFVLTELETLLDKNPQYRTRLNNIEAVIDAQRALRREGKMIGYDAVSAALMAARTPQGKNALTISGADHIMGIETPPEDTEGTFAQHLSEQFKTTTAFAGNSNEVREALLDYAQGNELSSQGHPFHQPNIMVIDEDKVITDIPESAEENSIEAMLKEHRDIYNRKRPNLKDAPFPTEENEIEVAKSRKNMQAPSMQEALKNLRDNEPWADLIANGRGEQGAERG